MSVIKRLSFEPRSFAVGELKHCLSGVFEDVLGKEASVEVGIDERLADGTGHSESGLTLDDLSTVCDLAVKPLELHFHASSKSEKFPKLYIGLQADPQGLLEGVFQGRPTGPTAGCYCIRGKTS